MNQLIDLATSLRILCTSMVEKACSGHPGLPLGMADVVTVLFNEFLVFNPKDPKLNNRDLFILSAGHGSALLYALLYLCGYERPNIDDLKNFRQIGSLTPGHPEYGHLEGVETTTGPLGQGIGNAVGMALSRKILKNDESHIYCLCSDGDIMEGVSYEAMSLACHFKLSNLTFIFDDNNITIDGPTSKTTSTDLTKYFESLGFFVIEINGHNIGEIREAFNTKSEKPKIIRAKTKIGFGSPNKEGTNKCHGSPLGKDEFHLLKQNLNWDHDDFFIPDENLNKWRNAHGYRFKKRSNPSSIKLPDLTNVFNDLKQEFFEQKPAAATRVLFQKVLQKIEPHHPYLVGGSADLTASNNTKVASQSDFPDGRYINYGVREHAMGSIMNGMALSGLVPYAGTFLVFSDYMRPAIRLSALMNLGVIYVFTHDSICVGEDGPTHQPIEQLKSLRSIPNLLVLRPSDSIEVLECFEIALKTRDKPSALILTRQNLPFLRTDLNLKNLSSFGGYILHENETAQITIIATGSEVIVAFEASKILKESYNVKSRIVSTPCLELFKEQSIDYRKSVLKDLPRFIIEYGISWDEELLDTNINQFFGMKTFGASGKEKDVIDFFNLDPKSIAKDIYKYLNKPIDALRI